jgi:dTDP-4-amino-4,6-dideoxygalactose transaminase
MGAHVAETLVKLMLQSGIGVCNSRVLVLGLAFKENCPDLRNTVHTRIGVGGRMDTLQCAIVLAKLDRFDQEIAQRQAVARRYHELLATDTHGSTRPFMRWPARRSTLVLR